MKIHTPDDVDKFLDKFEDVSLEVARVEETLAELYAEGPQQHFTDALLALKREFIRKLIMKAYRYGKSHGYEGAMQAIRRGKNS